MVGAGFTPAQKQMTYFKQGNRKGLPLRQMFITTNFLNPTVATGNQLII